MIIVGLGLEMSSPVSGHWWWIGGQGRQGRRNELGSMMAEIGWRRVQAQLKSKRVHKKPSLVQSPADSSIPTPPGKRTLLTLHQLFSKVSPAPSVQSSQAPHHSSTPTSVHQTVSVILHVGQICKENYESMEGFKSKALQDVWLKRDEDLTLIGWGRGT
ncbi:hypothetical protein ILYODFUR_025217 [Ilyodon furcidens]|uniref:Uncharacterized protein n=1 Tax=Ilyodon furcidens TaxID=33524 RepID=A0ABV0U901_9TELE